MKQQHFILVHGAGHGAWSWYKLAPLLESAGHRVSVPDLAASGSHERKVEEVGTFDDYSRPLLDILASLPPKENVILVGHGLGGINASLAADKFPEKVSAIVFAAALMPDCAHDPSYALKDLKHGDEHTWMDSQFNFIGLDDDRRLTVLFGPQFIATKVCPHGSQEDIMLTTTQARPACLFVKDLESKPAFSKDRYGSVPCFFIMCSEDAQISKEHQQWMIENHKVNKVVEIVGADHMPMLSKPQELCQFLLEITHEIVN